MTTAYPLTWPHGQPRTLPYQRRGANFDTSQTSAQEGIYAEIKRLGGVSAIMSTNIRLRNDGMPYAQQSRIEDPGVAVYFTYKKQPMVFACDKWDQIKDNMRAIQKTIEALRGIERWGSGDMMQQAFTGFQALPAPMAAKQPWYYVLGVDPKESLSVIEATYKRLAMEWHQEGRDLTALNVARDEAKAARS